MEHQDSRRGGRATTTAGAGQAGAGAALLELRLRVEEGWRIIRALHRWPGSLPAPSPTPGASRRGAGLPMAEPAARPGRRGIKAAPKSSQRCPPQPSRLSTDAQSFGGSRPGLEDAPGLAVIHPATGLNAVSADPNQTQRSLTCTAAVSGRRGGRPWRRGGQHGALRLQAWFRLRGGRAAGGARGHRSTAPSRGACMVEIARLAVPLVLCADRAPG